MSTLAHQADTITRQGHDRLSAELRALAAARGSFANDLEQVRDAAGHGETVSVTATLMEHATIERRIDELERILAGAEIAAPRADGIVAVGQRVLLRFGDAREPLACRLVGALEADASVRDISAASPIGRALLGHRAGDRVEVETPGGIRSLEVVAVEPIG